MRALLGFSFTKRLDYWLDFARDYVENSTPNEPFLRDNELGKKDRLFRDTLSKLDDHTKEVVIRLINSTATGVLFSLLPQDAQVISQILGLKPMYFFMERTLKASNLVSRHLKNLFLLDSYVLKKLIFPVRISMATWIFWRLK